MEIGNNKPELWKFRRFWVRDVGLSSVTLYLGRRGLILRLSSDETNDGNNGACSQQQAGPPGETVTCWHCAEEQCRRARGHRVWQLRTYMIDVVAGGSEGRQYGRVRNRRAMIAPDRTAQHAGYG